MRAPKKRPAKPGKTIARAPAQARATPQIAKCAAMYARALTDPHSLLGQSPCIPDSLSAPSFKFSSRTRSQFVIGTLGTGGLAVWPLLTAASDPVRTADGLGEYFKVATTTANYAQPDARFAGAQLYTLAAPPEGVLNVNATTSLFTALDFALARQRSIRLVGSGVKVSYSGSVVDQRGTITFIRNPVARSFLPSSFDDVSELLTSQDAVRIPLRDMAADSMNGVAYRPLLVTDAQPSFAPFETSSLGAQLTMGSRLGYAVLVNGGTPGVTFEIDVVSYFEAYGAALPVTASDSDPIGHASVMSSLSATPMSANPRETHGTVFARLAQNVLRTSGRGLFRIAANYLAPGLGEIVNGFAEAAEPRAPRSRRLAGPPSSIYDLD